MNPEEEKKNNQQEEKKKDPRDEVDTVTSKNDNMEPVPDKEELEEKKDPKGQQ